jgi:hypothetical protein
LPDHCDEQFIILKLFFILILIKLVLLLLIIPKQLI